MHTTLAGDQSSISEFKRHRWKKKKRKDIVGYQHYHCYYTDMNYEPIVIPFPLLNKHYNYHTMTNIIALVMAASKMYIHHPPLKQPHIFKSNSTKCASLNMVC